MIRVGAVYRLHCTFTKPPKEKYAICVRPPDVFFFINTYPPRSAEAGVLVQKTELRFLSYDSHGEPVARVPVAPASISDRAREHRGNEP